MSHAKHMPLVVGGHVSDDSTVAVYLTRACDCIGEMLAAEGSKDLQAYRVPHLLEALVNVWHARWELGLIAGAGTLSTETRRQEPEDDPDGGDEADPQEDEQEPNLRVVSDERAA